MGYIMTSRTIDADLRYGLLLLPGGDWFVHGLLVCWSSNDPMQHIGWQLPYMEGGVGRNGRRKAKRTKIGPLTKKMTAPSSWPPEIVSKIVGDGEIKIQSFGRATNGPEF
jgi:hypothetical protein